MRKIRVILLVVFAVAALAAISTPWILRAVSPQAACEVALVIRPDLAPLDPWGQPWQDRWHLLRENPRLDPTAFYSSGPNGRAEEGQGEQVAVASPSRAL